MLMQKIRTHLKYTADDLLRAVKIRDKSIPPMRLVRASPYRTFRIAGEEWKSKLILIGGLQPNHKILDIGCGSGRVSLALLNWIADSGSYDGIDIRSDEITWLQTNYSSKNHNFCFQHADIYNKFYNPSGHLQASEYMFPFSDETFDFIFLTSIFTHLLPMELVHYISELERMTKEGGHCFTSFFLLNAKARQNIQAGHSSRMFEHEVEPSCFTDNIHIPEDAVCYNEDYVLNIFNRTSLVVEHRFQGKWSFDTELNATHDYQDIIVTRKQ